MPSRYNAIFLSSYVLMDGNRHFSDRIYSYIRGHQSLNFFSDITRERIPMYFNVIKTKRKNWDDLSLLSIVSFIVYCGDRNNYK